MGATRTEMRRRWVADAADCVMGLPGHLGGIRRAAIQLASPPRRRAFACGMRGVRAELHADI